MLEKTQKRTFFMYSVGLGFNHPSRSSQVLQSGAAGLLLSQKSNWNRISVQSSQIEALGYICSGRLVKLWLLQSKRNLLHYHKFKSSFTFCCLSVQSRVEWSGGGGDGGRTAAHYSTLHVLHESALTELKTKDAAVDICSWKYNQIKIPSLHGQHTFDLPEPFFLHFLSLCLGNFGELRTRYRKPL